MRMDTVQLLRNIAHGFECGFDCVAFNIIQNAAMAAMGNDPEAGRFFDMNLHLN